MSYYPEVKVNEKGKKREIRKTIIGEERKVSLVIDNMIIYPKKLTRIHEKLFELLRLETRSVTKLTTCQKLSIKKI